MVKDAGVRYGGPWFELWQVVFFDTFAQLFYHMVTALLEYLNKMILHLLGFCFITLSL